MTADRVIAEAAVTASNAAGSRRLRPGSVVDATGAAVSVLLDGDDDPVYVERLAPGDVQIGARVMVQVEPPHGAFIAAGESSDRLRSSVVVTAIGDEPVRAGWPLALSGESDVSAAGAVVGTLDHSVYLSAGTWAARAVCSVGPNRGNVEVLLDGATFGIESGYSADASYPLAVLSFNLTLTVGAGMHAVTVRKLGTKVAASTEYFVAFKSLHLRRLS